MDQIIDIGAIKIKRELQPSDDISKLMKDIKKNGVLIPVAVNQKFELIDGLRRIEAARKLGFATVPAVICGSLEDVISEMERSHKHGVEWRTVSPKRAWEINQSCTPYVRRRIRDAREQMRGRPQHSKATRRLEPSRMLISKAIGRNSETFIGEAVHLWNLANNPEDYRYNLARELAERVEAGEVPLFGVRNRLERAEMFSGDVLEPAQQKKVITNFLQSLSSVITAARSMGPINPKIDKAQLREYLREMQELRRDLYIFVKTFEQEIEK